LKKILLILVLVMTASVAERAKLLDIVSENILKVEKDGEVKNVHLAGIALFSTANSVTREVKIATKDSLKEMTLAYMNEKLPIGSQIEYALVGTYPSGVQKVWLLTEDLNYNLIRSGHALVDVNDPYLPHAFEMRMTIAMKYAKDKQFGHWGQKPIAMAALVDKSCHMCGWKNSPKHRGLSRMEVLKELQKHLPKKSPIMRLASNKSY